MGVVAGSVATAFLTLLTTLIFVNVAQGLYPLLIAKTSTADIDLQQATPESLESLGRSGLIRLWHNLPAGTLLNDDGAYYRGTLMKTGPLHQTSSFITHNLFPPRNCNLWLGKFIESSGEGQNVFKPLTALTATSESRRGNMVHARDFCVRQANSRIDRRPCFLLDYSDGRSKNSFPWCGMRDELRMVRPGMYLGLGSMSVTGGPFNSALFVLEKQHGVPGSISGR
eukprot:jgi/Bigna1/131683/aug1.15_g6391